MDRHFSLSYHNISVTLDSSSEYITEISTAVSINDSWLIYPVSFVGVHRADYDPMPLQPASDYQFWFVFLRENYAESKTPAIQSQIVRICRNDPGTGQGVGSSSFTTFLKARIFCQKERPSGRNFSGTLDYQYNSICE